MFSVLFPENVGQQYWKIHYQYVLNILEYLKCDVYFAKGMDVSSTSFKCSINNKKFVFDFSDSSVINADVLACNLPIFKFHTKKEDLDKVIPFSPVSFYNWSDYWVNQLTVQYKHGLYVANRQRAYGNAVERRKSVKTLLESKFGANLRSSVVPQDQFWKEIPDLLVSVCIPGQNNNMVDRGQLEYFGFGCCTISPNLPEILPFNTKIEPNVHYLECYNDYSNLLEVIDIAMRHRENCIEVGQNAKKLFQDTCTPERLGEWIKLHL